MTFIAATVIRSSAGELEPLANTRPLQWHSKWQKAPLCVTYTCLTRTKLYRHSTHGWKQAWKCVRVCACRCVQTPVCIFEHVIIQKESINCFSCVDIGHRLIALGQEIPKSPLVYLGILFVRGKRHRLYESGNTHAFFSELNIHRSPTTWPLVIAWDLQAVRRSFKNRPWSSDCNGPSGWPK